MTTTLSIKNGVISRRSARIKDKRTKHYGAIFDNLRISMKAALNVSITREERITQICETYDCIYSMFVIQNRDSISMYDLGYKVSTQQSAARLFKAANDKIPSLIEESNNFEQNNPKHIAKVRVSLERFAALYKKTINANIFKAVLFSRVEIPQDVFKLVMEYYITSPF
jgi:hypothetical protein